MSTTKKIESLTAALAKPGQIAIETYVERNVSVLELPGELGRIMLRMDRMHPNHIWMAEQYFQMLAMLKRLSQPGEVPMTQIAALIEKCEGLRPLTDNFGSSLHFDGTPKTADELSREGAPSSIVAAAARSKTLKECADIVRKFYPELPT